MLFEAMDAVLTEAETKLFEFLNCPRWRVFKAYRLSCEFEQLMLEFKILDALHVAECSNDN